MQHHAQAKEALIYIENRHRDIMRLEQSIKELHQLFLDMAILVESQGELIDQIEYNVSQSVAYSKEAVKQLNQANQLQKKSRKVIKCMHHTPTASRKCAVSLLYCSFYSWY